MFRRPRDPQRQHMYAVEFGFEWLWRLHHPRRRQPTTLLTWRAFEEFCERIYDDAITRPCRHQAYRHRWRTPLLIERLDASAPRSFAVPIEGRLGIRPDQRTIGMAIHEVTHLIASGGHGWQFANVFRQMIGRHLHPDAERMLKTMYPWYGVRDRGRGIADDDVPPYVAPARHRQWAAS